jgi:hypothetical protein
VLADGAHVRSPLDYDIDELTTRLWPEAVVHVCSRDFPGEAIVFLVVICRAPDRGRRLFVFARTAGKPFSAGGISGFNEPV